MGYHVAFFGLMICFIDFQIFTNKNVKRSESYFLKPEFLSMFWREIMQGAVSVLSSLGQNIQHLQLKEENSFNSGF